MNGDLERPLLIVPQKRPCLRDHLSRLDDPADSPGEEVCLLLREQGAGCPARDLCRIQPQIPASSPEEPQEDTIPVEREDHIWQRFCEDLYLVLRRPGRLVDQLLSGDVLEGLDRTDLPACRAIERDGHAGNLPA